MRLRSDFWVAALLRRAEGEGAYVSVARRGAAEAGAIFVSVDRRDGSLDLYGPAPQTAFDDSKPGERLFSCLMTQASAEQVQRRMESETRFDPDLWLIDIEDREKRSFLDVAAGPA